MGEGRGTNRRAFYLTFIYGLWALMGAALGLPAAVYLLLPPKARKRTEWVEAGEISHLETGTPEELVYRHNRVDGWKITSEKTTAWVVKISDQDVIAFAPQCTHLGCGYHWDDQKQQFVCPCHSSTFSMRGRVLSGPAPRPLDRFEVKVEGGKIFLGPVHKSQGTA